MKKYDCDQLAVEMTFSILGQNPFFISPETGGEQGAKNIAQFVKVLSDELQQLNLSRRSVLDN